MSRLRRRLLERSTMRCSSCLAVLVLSLCTVNASALAQAPEPSRAMTPEEFSTLVRGGLPEDALIEAYVLEAEAEVAQARELPELGVALERQQVFVDGEGVVLQNSAALEWSIDISGSRGLRIDAAEATVEATRLRGERARELVALEAWVVYLSAARARLRLERLEQSRAPLAELTSALKRRAEEGDVSGADLARFELALAGHDDRIAAARAELEVAEKSLALLIGRPDRVQASDNLELPEVQGPEWEGDGSARSDLRAVDAELAGGRARVRAASRWWVPTLDVSAGYLSTDFGPGTGPGANVGHGYLATLGLSLPIFSRDKAERRRGEAQVARAQAARTILERRTRAEREAARTRLSSSVQRARTQGAQQVALATQLVEKTSSAYHAGEASALELRDAYEQLTNAQLREIDLRFEARLGQLDLWRAQGLAPHELSEAAP